MCVCVFFFRSSHLFWTSSSLDAPAGVTQEEANAGLFSSTFFLQCMSLFLAIRIQPFLPLVDREVEVGVLTIKSFSSCWALFCFVFVKKNYCYRDSNSRPNVSEGYEVTN